MIKSMDDLRKVREDHKQKLSLRQSGEQESEIIEVLVGMSTCGISSGARETFTTFVSELEKQGLVNTKVIAVGCIGFCHAEPTVQVNMPGQKPILYGNVKHNKVLGIVEKHIKGGVPVEDLIIETDFDSSLSKGDA